MASSRSFFISLSALYLLPWFCAGASTSANKRANQDRCASKVKHHPSAFSNVDLFRQHFIQAVASTAPVCFCFLSNGVNTWSCFSSSFFANYQRFQSQMYVVYCVLFKQVSPSALFTSPLTFLTCGRSASLLFNILKTCCLTQSNR